MCLQIAVDDGAGVEVVHSEQHLHKPQHHLVQWEVGIRLSSKADEVIHVPAVVVVDHKAEVVVIEEKSIQLGHNVWVVELTHHKDLLRSLVPLLTVEVFEGNTLHHEDLVIQNTLDLKDNTEAAGRHLLHDTVLMSGHREELCVCVRK